jgi:regulation of enolase protein 1 (concanavalin A-like superfamily)
LTVSPGGQLGGIPLNAHVGLNTFSVKVTDSLGASASANLLITVTNTNDAPVFTVNPISGLSGSEGVVFSGASIAAAAADPDSGDAVTFSKVSGPEWLVVSVAGALSGTPSTGSNGLNTFTVRATDQNGASGEASLQIQISSPGLPLPWNAADLAKSAQPGRASYVSGLFTLGGTGRIDGSSDSGCYVWQSFSGNGTIIARVNSGGGYDSSSLAGVMIRDSLASNSQHVFMGVDGCGYFQWVRRTITGNRTKTSTSGYGKTPDVWVSLVRKDRTITAYKSVNGSAWIAVGSFSMSIGNNCYIGLAACSGGTNTSSATFSDVQVRY